MVDGVLVSCYPLVNHDLSQIGMTQINVCVRGNCSLARNCLALNLY